MSQDLVILFSGGADSRLLMELAFEMKREPLALLVDYGQLHKKELEYAQKYCKERAIKYQVVSVSGLNLESALTGSGEKGRFEGVSIWNVPGRNTIFLSLAFSVAENNGIEEVWYGPDYSDREGLFPDCYQEYVYEMNKIFSIAGVKPIKLYAPLMGMTKDMILKILEKKGIYKEDLFSGYGNL